MTDLLSSDQIEAALAARPLWTRDGDEISRQLEASSFLDGIAIVDEVAQAAEAANHHPDIDIRWRNLTFVLSTHSEGGLTSNDFDLAAQIDTIVDRHSG